MALKRRLRLLSCGAGPQQLGGIKRALEMGVHVAALDDDDDAPGLAIADERVMSYPEGGDYHVVSFATDYHAGTKSKPTQKAALKRAGLLTPDDCPTSGRWVCKPESGSGSNDVSIVGDRSPRPGYVVEPYVDGTEYAVETFSTNGIHIPQLVLAKHKTQFGVSRWLVSEHRSAVASLVAETACRAVHAMGHRNGPSHTEIILGVGNRPYVVETHPRGGGFFLWESLVRLSTGFDNVGWTIKAAMGFPPWPSDVVPFTRRRNDVGIYFVQPGEPMPDSAAMAYRKHFVECQFMEFPWYDSARSGDTPTDYDRIGCVIASKPAARSNGSSIESLFRRSFG